jgi:hypothetical protein
MPESVGFLRGRFSGTMFVVAIAEMSEEEGAHVAEKKGVKGIKANLARAGGDFGI